MADLKNIALTVEANADVAGLMDTFGITEKMDLIRLGFSYGIRHGMSLERDRYFGTSGGSNYTTSGLDDDGLMAALVKLYYPQAEVLAEPYRAVETLMSKGLRLLAEHLRQGTVGGLDDLVTSKDEQEIASS